MGIESEVVSEVESVAGTAVGAATGNPLAYLKIAGYVIAGVAACYLAYRVISYVEQAAADHAAVQVITSQRDQAITQANSNAKIAADNEVQHEAVVAAANAATAAASLRAQQLASDLEFLRHAKPSQGCNPSSAATTLLQRLR